MNDEKVYSDFMRWLEGSWYGVPEPENAIAMIKARYSPGDAGFLTGIPFSPSSLDDLAKQKGITVGAAEEALDALSRKGLLFRSVRDGKKYYALNDIFMQIRTFGWPGRDDAENRETAVRANKYWETGFLSPWTHTEHKGLRVVPINKAVEDPRTIVPYEEISAIIDGFEYHTVSTCPCRQIKNLDPAYPDSQYPMDVCLHFDRLGHYIVENGMGREITSGETRDILRRCADAGLVHSISNQQEKPDTICNCDRDYCMWFTLRHKLGHAMSVSPSRYVAKNMTEKCEGCGLCVKRCPMNALSLRETPGAHSKNGKAAALNDNDCIGCGVCAHTCKSGSLALVVRPVTTEPPKTGRDFAKATWADFRKAR